MTESSQPDGPPSLPPPWQRDWAIGMDGWPASQGGDLGNIRAAELLRVAALPTPARSHVDDENGPAA